MKRIIFFACVAACVYCFAFGIYSFAAIADTFGKWYMGLLSLIASAFYGYFSYEKYKQLRYPWA